MWRIGCLLTVLTLVALPLVAAQWLPAWAVAMILVVEALLIFVGIPGISRLVIGHAANRMLDGRSSVLRDATMTLELIEPTEPVSVDSNDEDPSENEDETPEKSPRDSLNWVRLVCRIEPKPQPQDGEINGDPPATWDAADLAIVRADRDVSLLGLEAMTADKMQAGDGPVTGTEEVWPEQVRVLDPEGIDPAQIQGPATLEMFYGCPDSLTGQVKLRYYFESVGEFLLP